MSLTNRNSGIIIKEIYGSSGAHIHKITICCAESISAKYVFTTDHTFISAHAKVYLFMLVVDVAKGDTGNIFNLRLSYI